MAVRRTAGTRARRGKGRTATPRPDGLATTPTAYDQTSPDYVRQAGDADYLSKYSEEQIGMLGGREAIANRVAARDSRASSFSDPSDTTSNQESLITTDVPSESPGPLTPPTTYGVGEMPMPGKAGSPIGKPVKKKPGSPAAKKKLQKRIARTTGGTRREARGIMRTARKQVRRGNKIAAKRTISRALSGGPKAGVPGSPQRSRKAAAAATKITTRIATRQRAATPKRKRK